MGKKTPPFPNYPEWTQARFNSFIKSALRQAWSRYPVKYQILEDACVGKKINPKTGRLAKHYRCALCKREFINKEMQVDHTTPIGGPSKGGWDGVGDRMFISKSGGQALCKECHKKKTKDEKKPSRK